MAVSKNLYEMDLGIILHHQQFGQKANNLTDKFFSIKAIYNSLESVNAFIPTQNFFLEYWGFSEFKTGSEDILIILCLEDFSFKLLFHVQSLSYIGGLCSPNFD